MPRLHPKLRRRVQFALSVLLLSLTGLLALTWALTSAQGYYVTRITNVGYGSDEYGSHQRVVALSRGRIWIAYVRAEVIEVSQRLPHHIAWSGGRLADEPASRYEAPSWLAIVGIDWKSKSRSLTDSEGHYVYKELFLSVPYWLPIVMAGAGGWLLWRRARIEHNRLRRGLCPACGYDIRATPQRCSECGYCPGDRVTEAAASA